MDRQQSFPDGGVFISHHLCEGKHQYKVEKVVKSKNGRGGKMFGSFSKGDNLMEMNGVGLDNFTPEDLAHSLSEGNSKLKVHTATKQKEQVEEEPPQGEVFVSVSQDFTMMSFSWKMKRGEELEQNQNTENEVFQDVEMRDLLVINMKKTSISVVIARGCSNMSHGVNCTDTKCTIKEIVLVAEASTVTFVPQGGSIRLEKLGEVFIEHKPSHRYLKRICSKTGLYTSPNPEKITIRYYKSNSVDKPYRGMPVVLNFTDTNCFLKCCKTEDGMILQIETCEKGRLQQISKSDESTLAFVFYMKADRTKLRTFESALYGGWFICVQENTKVGMEPLDKMKEELFFFIIQK
ncbi:uncharacterized protein LOC144990948 isoform X1 [Oryzias latipes]